MRKTTVKSEWFKNTKCLIERPKDHRACFIRRDFSKCFRFFLRLTTRDRGVSYKAEQRERQVELSAKWSSRGDGTTERSRRERDMSDTWSVDSFPLLFSSFSIYLQPSSSAYSFVECHYFHTIHPEYLRSNWLL